MRLQESRVRELLRECDFQSLFVEELGWNHCNLSPVPVSVDGHDYTLTAISEMGGLVAFRCNPGADGRVPEYHIRRKIDREATKLHFEHIIVYCDGDQQVWQWVKKESGKPSASREHHFRYDQSGLPLIQKLDGLVFNLDELDGEGNVSISAVSDRVRGALDLDVVTKRFYDQFKIELEAFKGFITGLSNIGNTDWYSSLMLNRLMFIYFIQKKGFLNRDEHYLRNRLKMVQQESGKNQFYSFYRSFLRVLFHEGLNSKLRTTDLVKLLGDVPYLNGGLFEEHQIELGSPNLDIDDAAFERVFAFFDDYTWHLDTRPMRNDREINPDVLGYIFEKYINAIQPGEQKAKGAYYTKEDITGYIAQNTIIPYLFDAAKKKCAITFEGDPSTSSGPVWTALQENPDKYIYDAVKKGVGLPLPSEIAVGVSDVSQRGEWNKSAPGQYALPTEIWREVVARRQRYEEVKAKLEAGGVRSIDDLITFNLDMRQFAQDVIENTESPDLLRAFWEVLRKMTVLDPTCGSGAFLFAALNILEPLYEGCLGRMQEFVDAWGDSGKQIHRNYYKWFSEALGLVAEHPNRSYFIYKSIILNNLYGVDIMPEAVEICKLRLFLKLAAEVEPDPTKANMGLEPLPDIDFNIRAGNTLVGFATEHEVEDAISQDQGQRKMQFDDTLSQFRTDMADLQQTLDSFRQAQLEADGAVPEDHKQEVERRLAMLKAQLNQALAEQYGDTAKHYDAWLDTHKPFHWFVEFHSIIKSGGFDVVIGNPPYKELSSVQDYHVRDMKTIVTKNLYPLVIERAVALGSTSGRQGFIVPVSSVSTEGYATLQDLLRERNLHFSSFDDRPSRLFDGLEHIRLTIHLMGGRSSESRQFSTRYLKWSSVERPCLFSRLIYVPSEETIVKDSMPKLCSPVEQMILAKLTHGNRPLSAFYCPSGVHKVFYSRKVGYFLQVLDFEPEVRDGRDRLRPPSEFKEIKFTSSDDASCVLCALNSSLFYWFVTVFSDCRHLNKREVDAFPMDLATVSSTLRPRLAELAQALMLDLRAKSEHRQMKLAHDTLTVQCIIPKCSKGIIDEIDRTLAAHYGFTDEEVDFIINYDIKYRMGLGGGGDAEEGEE